MRLDPNRVAVVPPGVDGRFTPGGKRSATPLVVAVGRMTPTKRVPELVRSLAAVRPDIGALDLVVVGDGFERHTLERTIDSLDAGDWVHLAGQVDDDTLVDLYRRAWLVASASSHEGWGMTLTEAAACGTPAVATDIDGHRDAVIDGVSGILCPTPEGIGPAVASLVAVDSRRVSMGRAAQTRAQELSWDNTAVELMRLLATSRR